MSDDTPTGSDRARRAWEKPVLASASIKEITASGEGSGADGGNMAGMEMVSDSRLKSELSHIGTSPSGIPIYSFRYTWGPERHVGVLAQDLLDCRPEAVHEDAAGYYRVDYSRIDVEPRALD